ncbi:Flagellar P-ring protein [Alphaproteobacteria bacterium]
MCSFSILIKRNFVAFFVLSIMFFGICTEHVHADTRIKDIVYFEGVRDNMLVGYGLIVGLNGTGDNLNNTAFTENSLLDYLSKLGVKTTSQRSAGSNLNTKNVAAVMVTANLTPFARPGNRVDVGLSTLGDAKSLKGGNLLATPLLGADGSVYAVAQGPISIGVPTDQEPGKAKPTPTAGYITHGAIVESETNFNMNAMESVRLALKNPDITTVRAIANAINSAMRDSIALAEDPGTVKVKVPVRYRDNVVGLLAEIESISISPDSIAKIVIDEATGTVVIGENVKINKVAVAQGNLVLKVTDEDKFNFLVGATKEEPQPAPPGTKLAVMESTATLSDLVQGLNALGVRPVDLIAILKTIQKAGALQATIEVR